MNDILELIYRHGAINPLDRAFAYFMARLAGHPKQELLLGAALVSHATENGAVCLNLEQQSGKPLLKLDNGLDSPYTPPLEQWRRILEASPVVGKPGEFKPLILDDENRLYLYRYWHYEQQLAEDLTKRAQRESSPLDEKKLETGLAKLFAQQPGRSIDWQKIAATVTVIKGFSVISGAPGTGKTTTLAKILALLIDQAGQKPPAIRLAAPTGKAAHRMQEAICASKKALAPLLDATILAAIPEQAATLHRLLGKRPDSIYFRYNRDNPLAIDVLVIDEASMVDLPMMTKTVWALPPHARLILLGDKDQLSSVEAGFVLGDLCAHSKGYSVAFAKRLARITHQSLPATHRTSSALQDAVTELRHSYRFDGNSGIGRLAKAINQGHSRGIQSVIEGSDPDDIHWHDHRFTEASLIDKMASGYAHYLHAVRSGQPRAMVFAAFARYQVLCAQRNGVTGVENLNMLFEAHVRAGSRRKDSAWYPGRPIMITCNDYNLRLFNGDIGIALPDSDDNSKLRIYFQDTEEGLRSLPVTRLPAHETVFAMTIHKSQGSEFDEVLLVLPQEKSRVLTRELIYTGITRARKRVEIWGDADLLKTAAKQSLSRSSGLQAKLQCYPKHDSSLD